MSTAAVNNATATTATNTSSNSSTALNPNNNMNETDFLKLLVTEMTNQDPMQPMNDTQMVSEMAQFSTLEQMNNMNATMQMSQATSLIGSTVTWANTAGQSVNGTVGSVQMVSGTPYLVMQASQVKFSALTSGLNSANPSAMVGTTVSWTDSSGNTESGTVQSVNTNQGIVNITGDSVQLSQVLSVQG